MRLCASLQRRHRDVCETEFGVVATDPDTAAAQRCTADTVVDRAHRDPVTRGVDVHRAVRVIADGHRDVLPFPERNGYVMHETVQVVVRPAVVGAARALLLDGHGGITAVDTHGVQRDIGLVAHPDVRAVVVLRRRSCGRRHGVDAHRQRHLQVVEPADHRDHPEDLRARGLVWRTGPRGAVVPEQGSAGDDPLVARLHRRALGRDHTVGTGEIVGEAQPLRTRVTTRRATQRAQGDQSFHPHP
ncbi:hypothetical protein LI99_02370 [Mycolicibacterium smegmatis]|uniref:Uncharacterized protein n=2 Tax=Mycolicibacterium smegmatis (strain ATCC 700084 / mc(2)155) TaxID=246196 RepID=A0QPQ3_MYCS2|nr:hypothetical protein MSMEG_0477 [Mycolicibacterium smegmatis MC2 155]AIU12374.1 hypothetical protein LI99_02370 [Mycolicibacterium smegmatis]AFP36947.1 hypothetical protein MSMEI_0466 [Mycolicibacterium smegmatis MC2 155]AIU05749.1 hypothetical protein LJ00_02370 [Mycolicibacterium smegmatis MC2 155]AIU18998.1 hypothetical protein LI98_02370 [Mycolicibacterium smegmatis]